MFTFLLWFFFVVMIIGGLTRAVLLAVADYGYEGRESTTPRWLDVLELIVNILLAVAIFSVL